MIFTSTCEFWYPSSHPWVDSKSYSDSQTDIGDMLTEYAEIDDSIRKLWVALLEEQEHYVVSCYTDSAKDMLLFASLASFDFEL